MTTELLMGDVPEFNAGRLGADRWAVRHYDDVLSWGELTNRALRRAQALSAAGVRQGDFVVLALPNGNAFYELTFAIWKLGATPAVVSPRLPSVELRAVIETAGAKFVVADDPALIASTGALPSDFGRDHIDASPLQSLLSAHWKVMTSGGSTGRPKVIVDHNPARFTPGYSFLRLPADGVMLNPGPLYHNFPFSMTHMSLLNGTSVVGMVKFDPEASLDLIQQHCVEWVSFVPTMMNRIAKLTADVRAKYDMSSLKAIWHTAAPIPAWLKQEWIDWIGPERIWEMYGGTEGFCTTQLNGVEWLAHRGSVGRATYGEIAIRGEDGVQLPAGEIGEIYMRGPSGARRSYHYIGADSRRLDDGFESFGDYGWVDEDGYLYIADRRTDMIITGGSNIFPAEIEAALMEHPGVDTAIVIGLPHEDLGAVPHAIIQIEKGAAVPSEDELRSFAGERLVRYKIPRSFEFTDTPLRDEAGKTRRSQLRMARLAQ